MKYMTDIAKQYALVIVIVFLFKLMSCGVDVLKKKKKKLCFLAVTLLYTK